ncbi:MAG TPA: RNA-binding protein [Candidatus Aminicenantes bacterium]|nr:RNA-binding protein [Candidatus Aminicenantes bacterium]
MNIYVGNIAYELTEDELRETFSAFGEVESARIITDRFTGRSKGFGFVEMTDPEQAQKAIDEMNGREMGGRALRVNEARPRPAGDRPPRGGGFGGNRGGYDRY